MEQPSTTDKVETTNVDSLVRGMRPIRRLVVIGVGLIGGSFALALKRARLVNEIVGLDLTSEALKEALALGVIDLATEDYAEAMRDAELVFIATPMGAFVDVLRSIKPHLDENTIVTDGGSVKAGMLAAVSEIFGQIPPNFVLGHPIAGSEDSSVAAAKADLFDGHKVILTPVDTNHPSALHRVREIWIRLGTEVHFLDPVRHDQILAFTSHLPHLLAYSLVDTLGTDSENREIFRYAAGGFRDFTRIAASDPVMWRDIFLTNRDATLRAIDMFQAGLQRLRTAVDENDGPVMSGIFTRARASRRHFSKMLKRETWRDQPEVASDSVMAKAPHLNGQLVLPGDQSIAHRAIILASLSQNVWEIRGIVDTEDNLATIQSLRDMGVVIEDLMPNGVRIYGVGLHGLKPPPGPLYMGSSTTALLLFSGLLVAQAFSTELVGSESLLQYPVLQVTEPLTRMGASIESAAGLPPLLVRGGHAMKSIKYQAVESSARVKTALLLAALYADSESTIIESIPTRDHTERLMMMMGFPLVTGEEAGARVIHVNPVRDQPAPESKENIRVVTLPGDGVLGFYVAIAVALSPDSAVVMDRVAVNDTRMKGFDTLSAMSACVEWKDRSMVDSEIVASVTIRSSQLQPVQLDFDSIVQMKQEIPGIMLAASMANGTSEFKGLSRLSSFRSDVLERMQAMGTALNTLGVNLVWSSDICTIHGQLQRPDWSANTQRVEVDAMNQSLVALALVLSAPLWAQGIKMSNIGGLFEEYPMLLAMLGELGVVTNV